MAKLIPITIPKWGIEMERGTISEWRVAPGDSVKIGDELVDIETDKIVNSFEASSDGILVRIIAEEGEELEVGTLIGVMASEMVSDEELDAFLADTGHGDASTQNPVVAGAASSSGDAANAAAASMPAAGHAPVGRAIKVSPALRRKAERLAVDLEAVVGTGVGGRILRDDIEAALSSEQPAGLTQLQGAQKTIAQRMTLAKQTIPHFYLQRDCDMGGVKAWLDAASAESGTAVTVNHLLVYAAARALRQYPELNLNVLPKGVQRLATADVAIAVDTGSSLLTPVVRDIGGASPADVAAASRSVVERARNRQLNPGDLDGAAITVSNLGMFGVTSFTAIINPPQVMILAVGAIQERVIFREGQPAVGQFCSLTLACDHRVINGAAGARFLAAVCQELEGAGRPMA